MEEKKTFENYRVEEILKPIYLNGKLVYKTPSVIESKKYCAEQVGKSLG